MYMPGRSRTGSRPSSTVMSLAVYEVSVMKKALQVAHFRAELSLPDRAAGRGPREACARSFFHCFAKFFGVDRRRPRVGLARLLAGGLGEGLRRCLRVLGRGLRKRPRSEPEAARRGLAECLLETRKDLALEVAELECPGRGARVHEQGSVPRKACRPGVRRHLSPDQARPGGHHVGHGARRPETTELVADCLADPVHHAARLVPSCPCSTVTVCAGSPGRAVPLALLSSAWPNARSRSARRGRRPGSSSDKTSSSRSSGRVPRRSSSSSASPSSSARTASRCSPWEPKARRSRPAERTPTSSRCGPRLVVPRSRSRAVRASSSATLGASAS